MSKKTGATKNQGHKLGGLEARSILTFLREEPQRLMHGAQCVPLL